MNLANLCFGNISVFKAVVSVCLSIAVIIIMNIITTDGVAVTTIDIFTITVIIIINITTITTDTTSTITTITTDTTSTTAAHS